MENSSILVMNVRGKRERGKNKNDGFKIIEKPIG